MARRRFEMHHYRQALLRMRQGDSDRDLAAARIMGRRKAGQWREAAAAQGWLDAASPLPDDAAIAAALSPARRASSTVSSLEAHRATVARWVEQGVAGTAIHLALQRQHGWAGSYSAVRRLMAHLRAALPPEVTCRLEFAPGEVAQVDFGAGPILLHPDGKPRRTWAFVMTLAHSRHQYLEFVWDQTVATWLGCHRRALEWFGGVPGRLVIDNAKCAITRACAQDPLVQRAYAECAEGYGFKIDPCPPHDPQKKGIVESGVKYVKGNFLPLREFRDLADLNAQARQWALEIAGQRIHGTTRRRPLELFELERPLLKPLPAIAPDLGTWHRVSVHKDCHVQFERVLYSAPFTLVGKTLWLRATDAAVALYEDYRHVTTHARGQRPGQRLSRREHLPPEAQAFFAHDRHWCAEQAAAIGPNCLALVQRLLADPILERLRAVQGILALLKPYGAVRLEAACARALAHDSPYYRTVKTILGSGADLLPAIEMDTPSGYAGATRFTRPAAELFPTPQPTALH
ncbi:MAG TPA: IS21 family transposase [Ottowia sp.]|nr:IS21 family transposase [Rhodocyclaceae bacterium]HNL42459.1 IS21 family transposase [Ottowia sp.]